MIYKKNLINNFNFRIKKKQFKNQWEKNRLLMIIFNRKIMEKIKDVIVDQEIDISIAAIKRIYKLGKQLNLKNNKSNHRNN